LLFQHDLFNKTMEASADKKHLEWLGNFLENNKYQIIDDWCTKIHQEIPAYQKRPLQELKSTVNEHLEGIIHFFANDSYDKLHVFMQRIAPLRASLNFSLADIQKAFLSGKEVISDKLQIELQNNPHRLVLLLKALEKPFCRTIYEYSELYQNILLQQATEQEHKITKMREEQKFLQEISREKEKLELIIKAVGIDVALLNKNMEVEWSYSYLRDGKLLRNDRVGHPCSVLEWHEAGGCENCPAKRSFATRKVERGIAERIDSTGTKKTFQIVSRPILNGKGEVTHILEFVHEITNLCDLQQKLAEQSTIHSAIVNGSSHAFISINPDGIITSWNPAAEKIFGYPSQDAIGQPAKEIIPDLMAKIESMPTEQFDHELEIPCSKRDGCTILVEVKSTKIYSHENNRAGLSLIISDITEKRILEEKVLQAERMATVGQMASKVAHEIRNPLSSISLNSELLLDELESFDGVDTTEAKELLLSISGEIDRLVHLTEEYLNFSRLPRPKLEKHNINNLINEVFEFFNKELAQKNIVLTTMLEKDLPEIQIDKAQLRRVLVNLIRNSAEAMPAGGTITLQTESYDSRIAIKVEDTGEGIPEKHLHNIFNPFFSTKSIGTGLGLPIARQIIEEHGGQITCKSSVGHGTIFDIQLPLSLDKKLNNS